MLAVVLRCACFNGSHGVFAGGLLSAVYVYQFLHLHRQYGEYRGGTVCPAKSCGGQGTGGRHRCEPDHQQCSRDLLLADFTHDLKNLTIGVNLGGLGTLIASMASLISYKIYAHNYNKTKGRYLLWFTIANVLFLGVLVLVYVFIS